MAFRPQLSEMVSFTGHNGDKGEAYFARPAGPGPFGSIVVIHHFPGWDEWTCEVVRKFAHHGFAAIAPNLYFRLGNGEDEAIVAQARAAGGMPDEQVVGDAGGAAEYMRSRPQSNGKVGIIGFCSGGRHAYLSACRLPDLNALIDCWGGNVVVDPSRLTERQPVAPIDLTPGINCPVLGLFGDQDTNPSPEDVNQTEAALRAAGRNYEFHRYPDAGHAFFAAYRPQYRVGPAMDGWPKVMAFLARHLG